ncbi:hypothetical protein KFK09_012163 [Dendrobium nobile]|uniref:Uncharacterized protein n=1 Tax=Dendrobium nobile TaxID=94219 RepID=A0A8T3BGI3_DENNO|nr:hypothetical protein KFK09_012163 [Dendrobium nobile]
MVTSSRTSDSSSSRSKDKEYVSGISWKLSQLKKQVQASRVIAVREKILKNRKSLKLHTSHIFELAKEKQEVREPMESENLLSVRLVNPHCRLSACEPDKEIASSQEEISASASIVFGSSCGGKSVVRLNKLPFVEKIPAYTTWIFLTRNQRMAEDQSVLGRRQIYYDPYGNETLICSDSEEEIVEPEDEKHDFSEGEDQILWKAIQEYGLNQEVMHILCHSIEALPEEIQERYEALLEKYNKNSVRKAEVSSESESKSHLDKTLNAALDSFDNLFCRRCLIFDCRLHGCSQNLITASEKQPYGSDPEETRKPCSKHCYLRRRENEEVQFLAEDDSKQNKKMESGSPSESEDSNPDDDITNLTPSNGLCSDVNRLTIVSSETVGNMTHHTVSSCAIEENVPDLPLKTLVNISKRKNLKQENMSLGKSQTFLGKHFGPADKKQKKISASDLSTPSREMDILYANVSSLHYTKCQGGAAICDQFQHESNQYPSLTKGDHGNDYGTNIEDTEVNKTTEVFLLKSLSSFSRGQTCGWSVIEKDLYLKGIEIFGKNSCLIARNLLSGLKTCIEVSKYMFNDGASLQINPLLTSSCLEDSGRCDRAMTEHDMPARTKIWRKRGRARKLKYTWKSTGHPSIRKRIGDGKQQPCKQYTPCGCQQMCGKQCSCMENGTCCEKYCGCSKSCKNRFRGCHCAKSQCRSRQCPCFAAGRECDPDVCRNCWVSCGDGSLDEPQSGGDGYQCGNMKLLLKQQQRILLSRSDVAGWGAFIRNPVNKNDYLGEYTGELISHKEADKRGKIYDRANSSFLFDLNDQFVLDAYRKGDKLKFANHSSSPNCYAKVMLVAGDHRVGIYAKEHIEAGEELFYDYRYGPDQAPAWARKPEGSKRDDSSVSHYRAKKIA